MLVTPLASYSGSIRPEKTNFGMAAKHLTPLVGKPGGTVELHPDQPEYQFIVTGTPRHEVAKIYNGRNTDSIDFRTSDLPRKMTVPGEQDISWDNATLVTVTNKLNVPTQFTPIANSFELPKVHVGERVVRVHDPIGNKSRIIIVDERPDMHQPSGSPGTIAQLKMLNSEASKGGPHRETYAAYKVSLLTEADARRNAHGKVSEFLNSPVPVPQPKPEKATASAQPPAAQKPKARRFWHLFTRRS